MGSSINDVMQVGGRGVVTFVILCMKVQEKQSFKRDRGGRGVIKFADFNNG